MFRNYDEHGNRLARPRTLLMDSEQLESGKALDDNFRGMAADEIDRFRRELVQQSGDLSAGQGLPSSGCGFLSAIFILIRM